VWTDDEVPNEKGTIALLSQQRHARTRYVNICTFFVPSKQHCTLLPLGPTKNEYDDSVRIDVTASPKALDGLHTSTMSSTYEVLRLDKLRFMMNLVSSYEVRRTRLFSIQRAMFTRA
jgi:hypothetical protein